MGKKESKQRKEISPEDKIMINAIESGVYSLASQPGMKNDALLLRKNLDMNRISYAKKEIKQKIYEQNIPKEKQADFLYENLANYIASGNALNEKWEQFFFEKVHKNKSNRNFLEKLAGVLKPHKFDGEKYLERAQNAYDDMYGILAQNKNMQEELPELTKAAKALSMYGHLDAALSSFKANGLMDKQTYNQLSKLHLETASIHSQRGMKSLENYIVEKNNEAKAYQKIAAILVGILGIIQIVFNAKITGAVIGTNEIPVSSAIGALTVFVSLAWFFIISKKKI